MNDFLVRPVAAADFSQWLPLWDGYNAFYGRSGPTALPRAVTDVTWARFLDPSEPMHALVAESGGALIGLAHYLYHRNTIQVVPTCYMQDLFTAEAARGRGVGRALIETVTRAAGAAGLPFIYWHTHETNAVARKLYDGVAKRSGAIVYRKMVQ
jgi:GNAT superfamily N-acetyltransferase